MNNAQKVQKIASKLSAQKHLSAIRDGMAIALPLIIIGSAFMIIGSFPIKAFNDFLTNLGIIDYINKASNATFGFAGFAATFGISYSLAKSYKVNGIFVGLISLTSVILMTPLVSSEEGNAFLFKYFGMTGLFVGIIVALLSTEIYRTFIQKDIRLKMPDTVPPNVEAAFSALIPGMAITFFWFIILIIIEKLGVTNVHDLIALVIAKPLSYLTATLPGIIVVILIQCFFWFFGIHGAQVTGSVIEPLLFAQTDQNRLAFEAGEALPNIVTYEFLYNYVFPGGAGALIAIAILLYFFSKSEENKALGKLSLVPVSFQIAEPVIYGLPTVFNLRFIIPFVVAPVVNAILCYTVMYMGIVPRPIGAAVPWTTPPVIAGFLASGGSIAGALLNVACIVIDILIYLPFFRADDKEKLKIENSEVEE